MIEIPVNSKMNENQFNSKYNENQIPKLQRLVIMPILILNCIQNAYHIDSANFDLCTGKLYTLTDNN